MVSVTIVSSAKLEKPLGIGVGRRISADVTAESGDKISAADLGLRTIRSIGGFTSQDVDVVQVGSVRSPGSLMNVVDVQNIYMATTGVNAPVSGTIYPFSINVIGE